MLEDLKAGRIDGVVAWDIDRFTRQPRELGAWIDEYEDAERGKRHLVFDSVSASDIDLSTENGRFIARIKVTIANKSSADTSRRTKRKHLELAMQGRLPGGRAPYGWNRDDRRTLVPEEAEHLRTAVKDFLGGIWWASIARDWRDKGVRSHSGGFFDDSKIKRMLQIAELRRERVLHCAEAATFTAGPVDIRKRWEKLTIEQQRVAVLKVFRAVVIKPASRGPIFDPADIEPVLR